MNLLKLFNFIVFMINKLKIDESHGLLHSMSVLNYAHEIYKSELKNSPELENSKEIIYISAALHDVCDKKYISELEGIKEVETFLNKEIPVENSKIITEIISTMSYSTVKKNGFPNLGKYQMAYHIVREADLLASLDFDRCMTYSMLKLNGTVYDAFYESEKLFNNRMFKHSNDNLYVTEYSKRIDIKLKHKCTLRIKNWKNILKIK
jgi:HD superfamily phosphodiesterase